jgi:hypothetical protein
MKAIRHAGRHAGATVLGSGQWEVFYADAEWIDLTRVAPRLYLLPDIDENPCGAAHQARAMRWGRGQTGIAPPQG